MSVLLRAVQIRGLPQAFGWALFRRDPDGEGELSHGRALAVALAATGASGGVFGVAAALYAGGPGALLWMWLGGALAMATRYAEAVLGVRYRETDARDEKAGGPMYFLEHGLGGHGLGRGLALAFALLLLLAALGLGAGVPSRAVVAALGVGPGLARWLVGAVAAAGAGVIVSGGIGRIGRFAGLAVPVLLLAYVGHAGASILLHADRLPDAVRLVLDGAFGLRAAAGGALGLGLLQAVRHGLTGGLLAGQAGLGWGAIAAATARTREPARQALVAMTQPLLEAMVVGTVTGLALLCAAPPAAGASGDAAARGVRSLLAGTAGGTGSAVILALMAFMSIAPWAYYGERAAVYVIGERAVRPFRLAFLGAVLIAAPLPLAGLWELLALCGGLAALPNLAGLSLLAGIVRRETRIYFDRAP